MLSPSEAFTRNLSKLIQLTGWSQAELAKKLGVHPQALNRWIKGEVTPGIGIIVQISKIFGISLDDLLSPDGKSAPSLPYHDIKDCVEVVKNAALAYAGNEPQKEEVSSDSSTQELISLFSSLNETERQGLLQRLKIRAEVSAKISSSRSGKKKAN